MHYQVQGYYQGINLRDQLRRRIDLRVQQMEGVEDEVQYATGDEDFWDSADVVEMGDMEKMC